MENLKSFTIKLVALTVFMEIISLLWYNIVDMKFVSEAMPYIPLFFMAFTFIMHRVLFKTKDKEFKYFQRNFMLMTTIKLLSLLGIIMIYVFFNTDEAIPFSLAFFANYLAFTFFEARALLLQKSSD